MSRALTFTLGALVLGTTALARADRTETPAQIFKAGETVKLHGLGVKITLPATHAWTLSVAVDGTEAWDVLRPIDASTPGLAIELTRSPKIDCNAVKADLDARTPALENVASSPLAPETWDPWAYRVSPSGVRLCTNTVDGTLVADVHANVANAAPSEVVPLLQEVARVLGGKRSSAPLHTHGPIIALVGTLTLPLAGVRVVVPRGFSVKTTVDQGKKVDLLERYDPKDPPLYFTVSRALGRCVDRKVEGATKLERPTWLPVGFQPTVYEREVKDGHESTLCVELGPDTIVVKVVWVDRDDLPDVQRMLVHVAEVEVGVGASFSSSTPSEPLEEEDRLRATLGLTGHVLTRWSSDKAYAGGVALDVWSATSRPDRALGVGAELVGGFAYGTRKAMPWSARFGLGPSLSLGPILLLPLVTIGADGVGGDDLAMKGAGTWSLGGRVGVRVANRTSFALSGAEQWRFGGAPVISRERRFGVTLTLRSLGLSAELVDFNPDARAARLATFSVGWVL